MGYKAPAAPPKGHRPPKQKHSKAISIPSANKLVCGCCGRAHFGYGAYCGACSSDLARGA